MKYEELAYGLQFHKSYFLTFTSSITWFIFILNYIAILLISLIDSK